MALPCGHPLVLFVWVRPEQRSISDRDSGLLRNPTPSEVSLGPKQESRQMVSPWMLGNWSPADSAVREMSSKMRTPTFNCIHINLSFLNIGVFCDNRTYFCISSIKYVYECFLLKFLSTGSYLWWSWSWCCVNEGISFWLFQQQFLKLQTYLFKYAVFHWLFHSSYEFVIRTHITLFYIAFDF